MIVTIVTFHLAKPTTLEEITKTFQSTAPHYQGMPGLLRKNYFMSEDGRRAGGIYSLGLPDRRRAGLYRRMGKARRESLRHAAASRVFALPSDGRQPRRQHQRRGVVVIPGPAIGRNPEFGFLRRGLDSGFALRAPGMTDHFPTYVLITKSATASISRLVSGVEWGSCGTLSPRSAAVAP
jgi:hypothetical protein